MISFIFSIFRLTPSACQKLITEAERALRDPYENLCNLSISVVKMSILVFG